jgi:putative transposase
MAKLRIEPPAAAPRPRGGVRLRFGRHDRMVIDGVEYTVVDHDRHSVTIANADNADATQTLSREQIDVVRHSPGFRLDRNFYRPEVARARIHAGVDHLSDLPQEEQAEVLWKLAYCLAYIRMKEEAKLDKRKIGSDEKLAEAIEKMAETINATEAATVDQKRRKRSGRTATVRVPPGPQCLRDWTTELIASNMNPLALRTKHRKCGNRKPRFTAEEYAILYQYALRVATPEKPDVTVLWRQMSAEIAQKNKERRAAALPDLKVPSYVCLLDEVAKIPAFDLMAGQIGVERAKNYFRAVNAGLGDVVRPLERVEIDEWTVDLHILLILTRVWETLTEKQKAKVPRVRFVLCLAICVATKCIVGMSLARKASSANAIRTLDMIVSDKQGYSDAVGAVSPWDVYGTPEMIVADAGTSFANHDVRARVVDMNIIFMTTVSAVPFLRGAVERVFRTTNQKFIAMFAGRTFSDVVEKGDYDSQGRANLSVDEFAEALVRYKIDHYHNHEHDGLGGETPRSAWLRLTEEFGVDPPPDDHLRRVVFGMELRPVLDASGLRVLGIDYQSAELNELFHEKKHIAVSVRVDLKNLGAISVKIGSSWLLIDGPPELYKVTAKDWIEVWDEFQRRNAAVNKLTKPLLDDAIAHLTAVGKIGRDRMNIATEPMSAGEIAGHQQRMNIGVSFVRDKVAAKARARRGLLDGALTVGGAQAEAAPQPAATPRKRPKARKAARNVNAAKPAAATAPKVATGTKAKRPRWDLGSKK